MARPLDEEKRNAILTSATTLIAERGLGASTAEIAKLARIPHGSVFTYFGTKVDLFNELYISLKAELAQTIMQAMPAEKDPRERFSHLWISWVDWGVANPLKRRALAQLSISEDITAHSRKAVADLSQPAVDVVYQLRAEGALLSAPAAYVGSLVDTMAGSTIDFISKNPKDAAIIRAAGSEFIMKAMK